jgi:hypothetical protein
MRIPRRSKFVQMLAVAPAFYGVGMPAVAADAAVVDPCRLLTRSEVSAVLPGAQAGKPERTREAYGIRACVWEWDGGSFALQTLPGKHGAANEIRGLAQGYTNPLGRSSVRFETVPGVGDMALAVVEPVDAARGVIGDIALLTTQRGNQVIALQCAALARGERVAALKALTVLGRAAVARLSAP